MNLVLKRYDPYIMDPDPIISAILAMKGDQKVFTPQDLHAINNRCYFAEGIDGLIYGVVITKYYAEGQEVIFNASGQTMREAHYTVEYALFQQIIQLFNWNVSLESLIYALLLEACADTTNVPVIIDMNKQLESNFAINQDMMKVSFEKALTYAGFKMWWNVPGYWIRLMPIDFDALH